MSEPGTPEYAALFKENKGKIESKMTELFYQPDPEKDNKWAQLTVKNLKESVKSMNEEYLKKVLLGASSKEEKEYLAKLESELARRLAAEEKSEIQAPTISLFGD